MQTDLSDLTFLFHVRLDTDERIKNIQNVLNFHRKHCKNFKCVFVEDDKESKLPKYISLQNDDQYTFIKNDSVWNKCKSFNRGIKQAKTDFIAFHDLDVIIHPSQFVESVKQLKDNPNYGLVYPYSGLFLCVNNMIKNIFASTLEYNDLAKYYPKSLAVNYYDGNVLVGSTNSVGGCVVGNKDNVIKANGYNPNFIGWGYEDNEFPKRVNVLGFPVVRLTEMPLWHMPHDGPGSSLKADNPYYEHNRQVVTLVEHSTKKELQEYIKGWEL